jgi:hypothetical protein
MIASEGMTRELFGWTKVSSTTESRIKEGDFR